MGVSDIVYSRLHDDWFITYGWLGRTFRHIELGTSGYIEAETKMIYRRKLVGWVSFSLCQTCMQLFSISIYWLKKPKNAFLLLDS